MEAGTISIRESDAKRFDRYSQTISQLSELLQAKENGAECTPPGYLIGNPEQRKIIKATIAECTLMMLGLLKPSGCFVNPDAPQSPNLSLNEFIRQFRFRAKSNDNWFELLPHTRGYRQSFLSGCSLAEKILSEREVLLIQEGISNEYISRMKEAFQYDV